MKKERFNKSIEAREIKKCNHSFHGSLTEGLTRVINGKPVDVCPACGRNYHEEHILEACNVLGIEPKKVLGEKYKEK